MAEKYFLLSEIEKDFDWLKSRGSEDIQFRELIERLENGVIPPQTSRRWCGARTAFGAVAKNAPCFTVVTAENSIHGKQTTIFAAMGRERSRTMKFRNPETGEIFCSIIRLLNSFCDGRTCTGCALREPVIACADTYRCYVWAVEHPAEAARLMGYEILDDTSSVKVDTLTKEEAIKEIVEMIIKYNITLYELVDDFAYEIKNLY